jgi:hypothetical protein
MNLIESQSLISCIAGESLPKNTLKTERVYLDEPKKNDYEDRRARNRTAGLLTHKQMNA